MSCNPNRETNPVTRRSPPHTMSSNHPPRARRHQAALAAWLLCLSLQAAQAAPLQVDLPAQPLERSLAQLARQAGMQLLMPPELVRNRQAAALKGAHELAQALDELLRGSGLRARVDGSALVVEAEPARATGETELPAVRVRASATPSAKTEGSGTYTTGATSAATGLTLSLRDTPQSVTVITRERIDDQAMDTVADALVSTNGVSLKGVDRGRNSISVRGFDVTNFQFDGVPFATGNVGLETQNTVIYDRVEVVRGSTGLLSGAGEPSATINMVRKHADSKTFTGWASMELGSWNRRALTADLSTPLNAEGNVRARVVAHAYRQDAFVDLENTRGSVFYGVVDADLTPATRLSLGASDQRDRRNGVLWFPLPLWYSDGTRTNWDRSKTSATRWNQWDTTEQTAFASLQHTFENKWTVRADVSHHRQIEDSKLLWFEGVPDRATGLGMTAYPYHYRTEPRQTQVGLTATGPFEWLGRRHELTAGLLRNEVRDGWSNRDPAGPLADVGDFNAWDGSYPEPALGERYAGNIGKTTQTAAYAAARLQLTSALKLIAGARLSNWQRQEEAAAWTATAYTATHNRVLTPYAGLVADLNEQVSAYASFADIFNPQPYYRDRNGNYLDPLKGKSYETGLKGEFLEGRLNASAALFRIEQDNFAVADPGYFVPGTTDPAYRAAKGTVAKGYELEVVGEPLPGWNLSAGWTHYSAKDASGNHVASHHPRKTLKLASTVALTGAMQGLSIGGDLRWEDQPPKRQTNPVGVEEATGQPAYAVVDLMAKYQFATQWSLQLNVNNVFDKKYHSGSTWWDGFLYGEPRNLKLTARYQF